MDDLLARSLRDQQDLSAVERFAQKHERGEVPSQARYYTDLMPVTDPGPGQQYAFAVDLDRCTACKACVVACHNLNGLEAQETWRSTGLLIGGDSEQPFQQTVTTTCHHCVDPACSNGCPVNAYEKDPLTGIVKHLDDQCIGCKYCTLTCPYDVPKYSKSKGIVRKCDMCTDRLSGGEAPACVQACPSQAIRIHVVDVDKVVERGKAGIFLPGTPSPRITLPTTMYSSRRPLPLNLLPADHHRIEKEDAHLPLLIMLVLTQLSVGTFTWDFLLQVFWGGGGRVFGREIYSLGALVLGLTALGASMLHLGRPHLAFRVVLGLRRSWLSREIIIFGLYALFAALYAMSFWSHMWPGCLAAAPADWLALPTVRRIAFSLTVFSGVLGIYCSVMVYGVTRRPLWRSAPTAFKFFTTALVLGLSLIMLVSIWALDREGAQGLGGFMALSGRVMCLLISGLTMAKLIQEGSIFFCRRDTLHAPHRHAATLMKGVLRRVTQFRFFLGGMGGLVLPGILLSTSHGAAWGGLSVHGTLWMAALSFIALTVGELLERYLFFTTSVSTRMPGAAAP